MHHTKQPKRAKLQLLAAEDSSTNRLVLKHFLASPDLDVHFVNNGLEAVHAFQYLAPNIVLMDIIMPEMGGFDATADIRSYEWLHGLKRCPIIALTASSRPTDRKICLDADMDDYLTKPIDKTVLWKTIDRWIPAQAYFRPPKASDALDRASIATLPPADSIDSIQISRMKQDFQSQVFNALVKQYCLDAEQALKSLEYAVAHSNVPEAERVLHLLKGCSANFGAFALVELCENSKSWVTHSGSDMEKNIDALWQTYAKTKDQLVAIMEAH